MKQNVIKEQDKLNMFDDVFNDNFFRAFTVITVENKNTGQVKDVCVRVGDLYAAISEEYNTENREEYINGRY